MGAFCNMIGIYGIAIGLCYSYDLMSDKYITILHLFFILIFLCVLSAHCMQDACMLYNIYHLRKDNAKSPLDDSRHAVLALQVSCMYDVPKDSIHQLLLLPDSLELAHWPCQLYGPGSILVLVGL